jgi:hypothetical protein
MSLSKVLEIALGELGKTEFPKGSNLTEYGERYGLNGGPWCVIFLWDVFQRAGERMAFYNGGKTASCRTLLRCYREEGKIALIADIQVGDILILNFSGKMYNGELDTEHCALVVEKGKLAGTWYTVEGNTSPGLEGSQDNGGCVAKKLRHVKNVVAVCRPQYKPNDPQPVDDVGGHWFTPSVEWARERGLIKNYPDGSFKPNQPITRAEACVMLERFYQLLWEDDLK